MITANTLHRTFLIGTECDQSGKMTKYGTCFTVEIDGFQYIITAKHNTALMIDNGTVPLFQGQEWQTVKIKNIWKAEEKVDIAVISPANQLSVTYPIDVKQGEYAQSQEVYFLGFPYFKHMLGDQYIIPFVKKGIVSGMMHLGGKDWQIYLDGHNNPGFSGGPVIVADGQPSPSVIGVISAYHPEKKEVKRRSSDGDSKTSDYIEENSGIVISYGLGSAIDYMTTARSGAPIVST